MARKRLPKSLPKRSQRIIDALVRAEFHETDAWERDSQRIARMTVANAARGHPDPWSYSFTAYFGKPLEKALKLWAERSAEIQIELGRCRQIDETERAQPAQLALRFEPELPPKKPPQSVRGGQPCQVRIRAGDRDRLTPERSAHS